MRLITLIESTQSILKLISKFDLKAEDCKYIGMYYDYTKMRESNEKYEYAITTLSEKYKISKSKIKRLLHKFNTEI